MMKSKFWASVLVAGTMALGAGAASADVNLVQNPGFENGDLSSWSSNAWFVVNSFGGVTPQSGGYFVTTSCGSGDSCPLSQTLATKPGQAYTLSFGFNPGASVTNGGADTQVFWDGKQVADVGIGSLGWTNYTVNNLVATSDTTTLTFSGYQISANNGVYNVSVRAAGVPEVSSNGSLAALLAVASLVSMLWERRRRA